MERYSKVYVVTIPARSSKPTNTGLSDSDEDSATIEESFCGAAGAMTFDEAHRVIKRGDISLLRSELEGGLSPNLCSRYSWTLLMLAAMDGNISKYFNHGMSSFTPAACKAVHFTPSIRH